MEVGPERIARFVLVPMIAPRRVFATMLLATVSLASLAQTAPSALAPTNARVMENAPIGPVFATLDSWELIARCKDVREGAVTTSIAMMVCARAILDSLALPVISRLAPTIASAMDTASMDPAIVVPVGPVTIVLRRFVPTAALVTVTASTPRASASPLTLALTALC